MSPKKLVNEFLETPFFICQISGEATKKREKAARSNRWRCTRSADSNGDWKV
jgi:hypothetical protein